jgi:hypothetical protein
MTDDAERLSALENENVQLRAELARLRPQPRVVKVDGAYCLPSLEQVECLVGRVFAQYPNLRCDVDRGAIELADFAKMVRATMAYFGTLHRMRGAVLKTRDYLSWIFEARDELTRSGYSHTTDIRGSSFLVGCIAANDIPHLPPRMWPHCEVGLLIGIRRDSYPATNRWLNILAGGDFDPKLIVQPPAGRTFHPVSKVFDLSPPVNLAPKTAWRDGL